LLDGGPGTGLRLALDKGSDVCRPQLVEEGRKLAHCLEVVAEGSGRRRVRKAAGQIR
jgi:hypothetical protein